MTDARFSRWTAATLGGMRCANQRDMPTPAPIAHRGIVRRVASSLLDVARTLLWARRVARHSFADVGQ